MGTTLEFTLDVDKACSQCGHKGVGLSGLCITCAGKLAERRADGKIKAEFHVNCPHCKKPIIIRHMRATITPGVPAETEEWPDVLPDPQGQLFEGKE